MLTRRLFIRCALGTGLPLSKALKANAVERGLRFIFKTSRNTKAFAEFGQDYLWCFYTISASAADPKLKQLAWEMGQKCARRWRKQNPRLPAKFTPGSISYWVFADYSANLLGIRGAEIKERLQQAVSQFQPEDFLAFDPTSEPVPHNLPKLCPKDKFRNQRGVTACVKCGTALKFEDPYDLLCDAIITTYSGERYGVILGAKLADVMQHIPELRPYRSPNGKEDDGVFKHHLCCDTHCLCTERLRHVPASTRVVARRVHLFAKSFIGKYRGGRYRNVRRVYGYAEIFRTE